MECSRSVSEMLELVRRCACAECICVKVTCMDGGPLVLASSEKLSILGLTVSSVDYGALAHLHLPNLKVLFVHCINEGGFSFTRAISEFIGRDSGRSLQVLKLVNLSVGSLDSLLLIQDLWRMPIVEIHVTIQSDRTTDELAQILFQKLGRWKEVDGRFRVCPRPDIGMWSIGWVSSKVFGRQCHELFPGDLFDIVDVGIPV